ncbi:hypothetical protein VC83_07529 [Pseudogymnoascus destructans]|uniref:Beta-lactamase-like ARB-00930-like C-terminal domain-containing protein n=1 Tax=Pseudogymnoascus destructans TaxID=655981 RepID=A0A177A406_9PEZI|nr:uncharacterized protein VC83_07529 [Pseudogymnoascus destructans]OAF56202.1 hypothetical protein VC83_07529 [Pseudogymnoascus destructans]
MRKIGQAMRNSTPLSPAQTRRWLKPLTFTANDGALVGAPWETTKRPSLNAPSGYRPPARLRHRLPLPMYAGTYQCAGSNDTLVISVDANPGLLVTQFLINGTDAAKGFLAMGDQIRLTPSGLVSKGGARIGLRSVLTRKPIPEGAFVRNCVDWFNVGGTLIGGCRWMGEGVEGGVFEGAAGLG